MKLSKKILITILPMILLANVVIASDDKGTAPKISKQSTLFGTKKAQKPKKQTYGFAYGLKKKKGISSGRTQKPVDANEQALKDLEQLREYYKVEDYPAGSENQSTYTSLQELLADFSSTYKKAKRGTEEEKAEATTQLKVITDQAGEFRAGEDNKDIQTLVEIAKENENKARLRKWQLEAACIKEKDLAVLKERMNLTDDNIDLETGNITAGDHTYNLKNLIPTCYSNPYGRGV